MTVDLAGRKTIISKSDSRDGQTPGFKLKELIAASFVLLEHQMRLSSREVMRDGGYAEHSVQRACMLDTGSFFYLLTCQKNNNFLVYPTNPAGD